MPEPKLCAYGCGRLYVPRHNGPFASKGHKACLEAQRSAAAQAREAARRANEPPATPKAPPALCVYGCGKPYIATRGGRDARRGHGECYRNSIRATPAVIVEPKGGYAEPVRAERRTHPSGWEPWAPRVEVDGDTGLLVTPATTNADPERDALLKGSDLDPSEWEIVGDLGFNKWQTPVPIDNEQACTCSPRLDVKHYEGRWNYQYKAKLRRFNSKRRAEVAALIEEIRLHVAVPFAPPRGDDAFVVCISDTQAGKADGDGTLGMVGRFMRAIDSAEERIAYLRMKGTATGALYILGLGDLIEGCDSHYAQQTFRAENNERDQVNIMRRLILRAIERWAPLFDRVVVAAVGGNHGERRRDGKSFTDFADNADVAIFDQLEDIISANHAAYSHVSFKIPKDQLSLTLDMGGEIVGITHGHITGKTRASASRNLMEALSPAKRVIDWWAAQAHGQQPIGDARILFTGHYHHLLITESGSKTHIQVPALDGGSDWWRNLSGQDARPGMLTCRVGKNVSESGWADLEIL